MQDLEGCGPMALGCVSSVSATRSPELEDQSSLNSLVGVGAQSPPHLRRPSPVSLLFSQGHLVPSPPSWPSQSSREGGAREDFLGVCGVRSTCPES